MNAGQHEDLAAGNGVDRRRELLRLASQIDAADSAAVTVFSHNLHLDPNVFDPSSPSIKNEILCMIVQYLRDEGLTSSSVVVADDANLHQHEALTQSNLMKRMQTALLEGDWSEVKALCKRNPFRNQKSFLYAVYKQAFLEAVDAGNQSKAFSLLMDKLKPLEYSASDASEFKELCYAMTCKSVRDVDAFRRWDGAKGTSREALVERFNALLNASADSVRRADDAAPLPPQRLVALLRRAVAHQITSGRYHPRILPHVKTLLEDYSCFIVPNHTRHVATAHTANVKALEFIGDDGGIFASAGGDKSIRLWDIDDPSKCVRVFEKAHNARIWSLSSNAAGKLLASCGGDACVKVWNLRATADSEACQHTLLGHEGDVYSVDFHPGQTHVVSGGYDTSVRLWDVRSGRLRRVFDGHRLSVASAVFNPYGNLIISGSKDATIRVWDIVSGLSIRSFASHLGEVTSVAVNDNGNLMLSASKDNSHRLWDLRTSKPVRKFKGHQNTSKSFIRARFGPSESLIISGSEDGNVYLWDLETGNLLQTLRGHDAIVYDVQWNKQQTLLLSCSEDKSIRVWDYDEAVGYH